MLVLEGEVPENTLCKPAAYLKAFLCLHKKFTFDATSYTLIETKFYVPFYTETESLNLPS